MMMKKSAYILVAAGLAGLVLNSQACSVVEPESGTGGNGGSMGNQGGGGGSRTGGTGGSRTGGAGGARTGGDGGSAQGGTGGTGTGGNATGGNATGGDATGGTGTGGNATGGMMANVHPVWHFEDTTHMWVNGVDHFDDATARCDHGRIGIGQPMVDTTEKMQGNSSIRFDIDIATGRAEYNIFCERRIMNNMNLNPNNAFAVLAPLPSIQIALARLGILNGRLPAGSIVTWNLKFSEPGRPFQAFILGVGEGLGWQSVNGVTSGNWQQVQLATAPDKVFPSFGWAEIGILFNGPFPANFTGTLWVDAVDIELPP